MSTSCLSRLVPFLALIPLTLAGCAAADPLEETDDVENVGVAAQSIVTAIPPGTGVTVPPVGTDVDYLGTFRLKNRINGSCAGVDGSVLRMESSGSGTCANTFGNQLFAIYKSRSTQNVDICIPATGGIFRNEPLGGPGGPLVDVMTATCLDLTPDYLNPTGAQFRPVVLSRTRGGVWSSFGQGIYQWDGLHFTRGGKRLAPVRVTKTANQVLPVVPSTSTNQEWTWL